jgi:hypothetical protein
LFLRALAQQVQLVQVPVHLALHQLGQHQLWLQQPFSQALSLQQPSWQEPSWPVHHRRQIHRLLF